MAQVKRIAVIGATGSVGGAVLDVCARFPERFDVIALAAKSNRGKLVELGRRFGAEVLCLTGESNFQEDGFTCFSGVGGLAELVTGQGADHVVFSSSGTDALQALLAAVESGQELSLSNKEMIVAAGKYIMPKVKDQSLFRPVDSEHNAVWQCLRGEPEREIRKIWLTASGGPFREFNAEQMKSVTPEMALKHPVWQMGAKITIDSATMMNKGLECIEAMHLFGLSRGQVGALIHPSSQAHGLALFNDGSIKMLIAPADMRVPCAAALAYPTRLDMMDSDTGWLTPDELDLRFEPVDEERFPCLGLAMRAAELGGPYPPLLVGADETAVSAFLREKIGFTQIPEVIESVLAESNAPAPKCAGDAIALIAEGERMAGEACRKWGNRR